MTKGAEQSRLLEKDGGNLVFLLGAPRSGTTWLANIFDSHPDVLYRHEPDTVLRSDLPVLCTRAQAAENRDKARRYLSLLMDVRTQKSAGSLPMFPKAFRGRGGEAAKAAYVYGLRIAERLSGAKWPRAVTIPDFLAPGAKPVLVMKSVSSRGRARLFAEALPASRVVFIIRHPCGQVASMMAGIKRRKLADARLDEIFAAEEAAEYGLTREIFQRLSPAEQCAWHWAILNQKAANDLAGLGRAMTVLYEDVCRTPEGGARSMFEFAGLPWNAQTADFVHRSTAGSDTRDYFRTTRDSLAAAEKWKTELSAADQAKILRIAALVPVGQRIVGVPAGKRVAAL